jgi:hypothetical protein
MKDGSSSEEEFTATEFVGEVPTEAKSVSKEEEPDLALKKISLIH